MAADHSIALLVAIRRAPLALALVAAAFGPFAAASVAAVDRPRTDVDVERYRFAVVLRDDTDRIEGEALIELRWLEAGHRTLRLDLVGPDAAGEPGRGMVASEVSQPLRQVLRQVPEVSPDSEALRQVLRQVPEVSPDSEVPEVSPKSEVPEVSSGGGGDRRRGQVPEVSPGGGGAEVSPGGGGAGGGGVPETSHADRPASRPLRFRQRGDDLLIELPTPSIPGERASYLVRYAGVPADGLTISANRHGDRTFFADHWPDRARHWLPVVDHPSDKAYVVFDVTAPAHYQVVASGSRAEATDLPGNRRRTRYESTAPLATKVAAVAVARFAVELVSPPGAVPVETWVFPQDRDAGFATLEAARRVLEALQAELGPFPYAKLANVQSRTRFGGMENAGAIFYNKGVVAGGGQSEALIAHEVAHQWFGDAVTERDWPDLWLSEGFATYLAHHWFERSRGRDAMAERLRADREQVAAYDREHAEPVVRDGYERPGELLDLLVYRKAGFVLHMLRREIGERAFWDALRAITSRYRHVNAGTAEVEAIFEELATTELDWFFDQWLRLPGHPQLAVTWSFEPARAAHDAGDEAGTVRVEIEQVQAEAPFRFPLDVALRRAGAEVARGRVEIAARTATLEMRSPEPPDELVLDPDVWLLFEEIGAERRGTGAVASGPARDRR